MFKTLLIFIGLYFFFRFIARVLLPFFIGKAASNMHNKQNQAKATKKKPKPPKPKEGEYIDYEEVE